MNNSEFNKSSIKKNANSFLSQKETAQNLVARLEVFIDEYKKYKSLYKDKNLKILDIAAGRNPIISEYISPDDQYSTCDFYENINKKVFEYKKIDLNNENLSDKFKDQKFDVIFCGEIIEHLFSPDHLILEIKKLMHKDSILILSTPNLSYYMNRIMLLFGVSPFFLENSSEYKFGRKFKFLGNRNSTEGHIRLFTYDALKEFLIFYNFRIEKIISSTGPWKFFLDEIVMRFSKSLSPTNVFVLKLKDK